MQDVHITLMSIVKQLLLRVPFPYNLPGQGKPAGHQSLSVAIPDSVCIDIDLYQRDPNEQQCSTQGRKKIYESGFPKLHLSFKLPQNLKAVEIKVVS